MNIVIFGATGTIGHHLVKEVTEAGHTVRAFTRDPAKLQHQAEKLNIFTGDVLDAEAVISAIKGQDAVLCALGAGARGNVRAAGTANIIRAMKQHNVSRLICQTTLGAGASAPALTFFWKYIMFGMLLRAAFADHQLQEQYIMESGLDWTIVRPAAFTDGPSTTSFRHGFAATTKDLALKISRIDVARFMLQQLSDTTYMHRTPGLSY